MQMTGQFKIVLLPSTDEEAFERHMRDEVFTRAGALRLTRLTSAFEHKLFRGQMRQYVWQSTVTLVGDRPYDFAGNAEPVQAQLEGYGILIGIEAFANVA